MSTVERFRVVELDVDVTDVVALGEPATVAVTVHLPEERAHPQVVCFAKPGAGFTRRYFTDDLPGPASGAQAAWHASRGWVFVSCDHLGIGDSSRHDGERLDFPTVTRAADAAERRVLELLAGDGLGEGEPVRDPVVVGIGQSMGGALLVVQQARHRTYDGIGMLGYSAVHTTAPTRPGSTPTVLPWLARSSRRDDPAEILNLPAVLAAAARAVSEDDFLADIAWGFHDDDVDRVAAASGRWISDGYLSAVIAHVTTPGVVAAEAAAIDVPVLVAAGARDTLADPRGEPRAYLTAPSVDLFICPRMAHMHNFAGTRCVFWERIETWAHWVGAHRASLGTP
jgi:alpha-beta hydrolase superfamily lysophospholipase